MSTSNRNVWFITGTSTGFGRSFAEYAIGRNYQVVVTARNVDSVQDLVHLCPERVLAVRLDVNKIDDVRSALKAAVDRFGGIDVLINNAGIAVLGPIEETSDEQLHAQFNTNFFAAFTITREVLPLMRAQKSGAIVQISSVCGSVGLPGFGSYSASKFALEGFSESLHAEVAPFGIKVMIAKPGPFRTEMANKNEVTTSIGVYDKHPAGQCKNYHEVHGTQPGDPARAAQAVDTALRAENTPLRLLLGNSCCDRMGPYFERQIAEYKEWDAVSRSADYPK